MITYHITYKALRLRCSENFLNISSLTKTYTSSLSVESLYSPKLSPEMPTVGVKKELLLRRLGDQYANFSDDDFDELCFQFGLELDEATSEYEMIKKEQGAEKASGADTSIIYKIDVPANRYDLLCVEGLARGLKIFLRGMEPPLYKAVKPESPERLIIHESTAVIRPFAVSAVLRGLTLDAERYESFIDLQEKLHQNLCRKRTLVAIGTHDLDTIQGPFHYMAQPPADIKFIPLNKDKEYTAVEMMDLYSGDSHLKSYLPIIRDSDVYPIIYDANGVVLSMPPIINGDHTKITLNTKNIFIDMTATDENKASIALDMLVTMFSEYCTEPFSVEAVDVVKPDGSVTLYPKLPYRQEVVSANDLRKRIGINQETEKIAASLSKMCLPAVVSSEDADSILVTIPPTRPDVIHKADIVEDAAIAYGYDNIAKTIPNTNTTGRQRPLNQMTDLLRQEIAHSGFTECLSFILCSREDVSTKLRKTLDEVQAVQITKPKAQEFQVARTHLLPGILKTAASNKGMALPLRLFEISDVVVKDPTAEVGAKNRRHFCAINYNKSAGFELIHGLLDRVMQLMEVPYSKSNNGYHIREASDSIYFNGRCASIIVDGTEVGKMGTVHPEVSTAFDLLLPVSAIELDIQAVRELGY